MKVRLHDASGSSVAEIWIGDPVPGRTGESYMSRVGEELVLRMNAYPRPFFDWRPDRNAPPMVDRRVVPLA